jgi:prevent-host-death family protein
MASISVSEFKATCLSLIEQVRQTGQTIVITKHGQAVAELVPSRPPERKGRGFLGRMRAELEITGDVTAPVLTEAEWTSAILDQPAPAKKRRK